LDLLEFLRGQLFLRHGLRSLGVSRIGAAAVLPPLLSDLPLPCKVRPGLAREFDSDTGLQYNRARCYDAVKGTWLGEGRGRRTKRGAAIQTPNVDTGSDIAGPNRGRPRVRRGGEEQRRPAYV
jgi:hypothetical protein